MEGCAFFNEGCTSLVEGGLHAAEDLVLLKDGCFVFVRLSGDLEVFNPSPSNLPLLSVARKISKILAK
jgi:hypothetical protein